MDAQTFLSCLPTNDDDVVSALLLEGVIVDLLSRMGSNCTVVDSIVKVGIRCLTVEVTEIVDWTAVVGFKKGVVELAEKSTIVLKCKWLQND